MDSRELAELARHCVTRAQQVPAPARVEEDARDMLQRLVDDRQVRLKHRDAARAIRRALAVDLQRPENRRGDLPRALGLVSRVDKGTSVKHLAISLMMENLLDHTDDDGSFPYGSKRRAAEAVVEGFYKAGINIKLTAENVERIWERYWKT
jgi:hypothetical protein